MEEKRIYLLVGAFIGAVIAIIPPLNLPINLPLSYIFFGIFGMGGGLIKSLIFWILLICLSALLWTLIAWIIWKFFNHNKKT